MKCVILKPGPMGMERDVARAQMNAAKKRAGGDGELTLTGVHSSGVYLAVFSNNDHAGQFIRFLRATSTVHVVLVDSLPPGFTIREVNAPTASGTALAEIAAFMERMFGSPPLGGYLRNFK